MKRCELLECLFKRLRGALAWILLGGQFFAVSCRSAPRNAAASATAATQQQREHEESQMLTERILEKDRTAILTARQMGPAASAELTPLLKNADPEVREIAVYCLDETGGPAALQAMASALSDENPQVRGAALQGLQHRADRASYDALLAAYDRSQDAYTRQQVMLILGRIAGANDVGDLKRRCVDEKEPTTQEGCVVSLALLNDDAAQKEFIRRLQASKQQERARYLDYSQLIHAAWLVKPLAPILDDKTPMVRVGVDARPDLIQDLRACDLALNLIVAISRRTFSFPVNRATNYSDAQIAEVRSFAQRQP